MSTVLLSVGDASGDVVASDFVRELRALRPGTHFLGMGGMEMTRAGVELVVDQRDVAVSGLVELLPDLPRIVGAWRRMMVALRANRPDLVVLVDSRSCDDTEKIARERADRFAVRAYQGDIEQKSACVEQASHDWVLVIDPDGNPILIDQHVE